MLNGLRLTTNQWDRALMPTDGELPKDDQTFQQLIERLRRIGRMVEGHYNPPQRQGATGDVGAYAFFPTFEGANPLGTGYEANANALYRGPAAEPFVPNMPAMPSASGANVASAFASVPLDDDEEQCNRCGMFYEDEFFIKYWHRWWWTWRRS